MKMQSDLLTADMSAFKAANPAACLADFVRWHSPRDWIEPDAAEENAPATGGKRGGAGASDLAPRGTLSGRMRQEGNVWKTLWRDSPRCPADQQRLLFDPIREGEKVLHYLAGRCRSTR